MRKYYYIRISNMDGIGPFTTIPLQKTKDIPTVLEYVMEYSVSALENQIA